MNMVIEMRAIGLSHGEIAREYYLVVKLEAHEPIKLGRRVNPE
jgi:hypothetical protein